MTDVSTRPAKLCLSVDDVGEVLGISRRGVYVLAERSGLPTIKLGGRRLIRRADLERWLASQPVADDLATLTTGGQYV
ncbi:MAG TPA: helix-turn-helix domain-containing protein [Phycisphaerae bacterium]|nr:helix-turn-helix domain-containing protein [Phycisphaerae bacterium]